MRTFLTFLICCFAFTGMCHNATFEKLAEVNKCWRDQKDVQPGQLGEWKQQSERAWIRQHLSLVEQVLRQRSTAHLTAQQAANRSRTLDQLNEYWHAGNFPINEDYSYRTPIFIDNHDNFCAVGYLVKASGHEAVSRMISAKTNLAYVKEMKYPELNSWAADYGFTIDELAWIQPAYAPVQNTEPVGKGVAGEVKELFVDGNIMYVGGKFSKVDSTITANNIAYVTESAGVYTWHSMGTGVNGTVNAIAKMGNNIYVAGDFTTAGGNPVTSVAYWDGSMWHSAGCIYGTISDLLVFNNELYAAGDFDVCAALSEVNFAKWNGTNWFQVGPVDGRVNTMEVVNNSIVLGGAFSLQTSAMNLIKWTPGVGLEPFFNSSANEVMDFEKFKDTLYAVCKRTSTTDTNNLFLKLKGNSWIVEANYATSSLSPGNGGIISLNTLCADGNALMLGGNFHSAPMVGTYAMNCLNVTPSGAGWGQWFVVDSAINKMVIFKGDLISGGKFKYNSGFSPGAVALNGMARRKAIPTSVPELPGQNSFSLYPNPVKNAGTMTLKNNFEAKQFVITDLMGKQISRGQLTNQATQNVSLPELSSGVYLIQLVNDKGAKVVKKFTVE